MALVNFVGHGSAVQLADEKVLLDSDVGTLANAPRFPVFITASCDVGKFSDPTVLEPGRTAGDQHDRAGRSGVISATELAYSRQNATLNQSSTTRSSGATAACCQYHVPVAAALLATKAGSTNGQKYQLMGDAATCVALPRLWVELALTDSAGGAGDRRCGAARRCASRAAWWTARAASRSRWTGAVAMPDRGLAGGGLGLDRVVYGGVPTRTPYFYDAGRHLPRRRRGERRASSTAASWCRSRRARGSRGRLRAYVRGLSPGGSVETDGVGSLGTAVAAGEAPVGDATGPRIGLSFVGGSTTVRPDAVLTVDLYDESGILTTNHTPQNGIIVTIDGSTTTRADVTGSFRYAANSYQSGTASYTLPNLAEGAHT